MKTQTHSGPHVAHAAEQVEENQCAVRQSREYVIPGEGQKNQQRTQDVNYIKDSPRHGISCTAIHEEMLFFLPWRVSICSVRHRQKHQHKTSLPSTVCDCVRIKNSSL